MEYQINGRKIVVITRPQWKKKLQSVLVRKEFMNQIVMNFMETEGHVNTAETFRDESGTERTTELDRETITRRMSVKNAVQLGAVEDAIDKALLFYPGILESNNYLLFHLQQQQLIELIRQKKVEQAREIFQGELALLAGEEYPDLVEELGRTVSLLFENSDYISEELLEIKQRLKTASELNAAILSYQGQMTDSWLSILCKSIKWMEQRLNWKVDYPRMLVLETATLFGPIIGHPLEFRPGSSIE